MKQRLTIHHSLFTFILGGEVWRTDSKLSQFDGSLACRSCRKVFSADADLNGLAVIPGMPQVIKGEVQDAAERSIAGNGNIAVRQ